MIEAKGTNGQIQFDDTYVTITRKGIIGRSTIGKGDKRIPLSAIVSVQWKQSGWTGGFIQFETAGVGGTRSRFGRQVTDASRDENSVLFTVRQQPAFEHLRAAVEQALAARHNGQQMTAPASLSDELTKLGALVQQGLLSQREFEAAKARLLGG